MSFAAAITRFLPHSSPARPTLVQRLRLAASLSRQRQALGALPPERLHDLGLTAQQAQDEAKRPFWDAPLWWRS